MIINYFIKDIKLEEIWPLEEVKNYLRISHNYDDQLLRSLIESAKEVAEKFTGLSINQKRIECKVQNAKKNFSLKYLPILNIEEVILLKKEGGERVTDKFGQANIAAHHICLNDEYIGQDIEIRYIAGYVQIPKTIKHAILMHVASMYEYTENGTKLNSQIKDLYQQYRVIKI